MLVLMIADAGAVTYTVAAPVFVCLQAVHAIVGARCRRCALPGVFTTGFLFIFARILGYFYFLLSTAFLMHSSAYTAVLKHLLFSPSHKRHRTTRITHPNPQALLT